MYVCSEVSEAVLSVAPNERAAEIENNRTHWPLGQPWRLSTITLPQYFHPQYLIPIYPILPLSPPEPPSRITGTEQIERMVMLQLYY